MNVQYYESIVIVYRACLSFHSWNLKQHKRALTLKENFSWVLKLLYLRWIEFSCFSIKVTKQMFDSWLKFFCYSNSEELKTFRVWVIFVVTNFVGVLINGNKIWFQFWNDMRCAVSCEIIDVKVKTKPNCFLTALFSFLANLNRDFDQDQTIKTLLWLPCYLKEMNQKLILLNSMFLILFNISEVST